MTEEKIIYLCEDSTEGIFTAIYQAFAERHGHSRNRIMIHTTGFNRELFCEYREVANDYEKAVKVADTIQKKISVPAYEFVQKAAASCRLEKADAIYRFIIEGLAVGERVLNHLTAPFMKTMFELERYTTNEAHYWVEFLRFEELENGMLFGRINPRNKILPFLAGHFSDRFSGEDWMIADTVHRNALIHRKNGGCILASLDEVDLDELVLKYSDDEKDLQSLWKLFVDTAAIEERVNRNLQRQMLPLRYRKYMREFSAEDKE